MNLLTKTSFSTVLGMLSLIYMFHGEADKMLGKGTLEEVENPGLGYYGRMFLLQEASGGWRPVISLSSLNNFATLTKFKMETVLSVLGSIKKGDVMFLKVAYFQITIHPDS